MSNVTMGAGPNINLYGKEFILCSVAMPSLVSQKFKIWTVLSNFTPILTMYFYFCPSTEAKYGKDDGLLSNCGARDCLITLQ